MKSSVPICEDVTFLCCGAVSPMLLSQTLDVCPCTRDALSKKTSSLASVDPSTSKNITSSSLSSSGEHCRSASSESSFASSSSGPSSCTKLFTNAPNRHVLGLPFVGDRLGLVIGVACEAARLEVTLCGDIGGLSSLDSGDRVAGLAASDRRFSGTYVDSVLSDRFCACTRKARV